MDAAVWIAIAVVFGVAWLKEQSAGGWGRYRRIDPPPLRRPRPPESA